MHKDKRQQEAEDKGDLDHRIIVAGPETRARENEGKDPEPARTVVRNGKDGNR